MAPLQQGQKFGILQRSHDTDPFLAVQHGKHAPAERGIGMGDKDNLDIPDLVPNVEQAGEDLFQGFIPVLPPVQGHENPPQSPGDWLRRDPGRRHPDRVDTGVAGHENPGTLHAVSGEIVRCRPGRGEMQVSQLADHTAPSFLREGCAQIKRAKTGLYMGDRNPTGKGRQGAGCRAGGIPLNHHQIGKDGPEGMIQLGHDMGKTAAQTLGVSRRIEQEVRGDPHGRQGLLVQGSLLFG
jgi:hypothetical protein